MNDNLQRAFKETHYVVHHHPTFTLRIGQPCPILDEILKAGEYQGAAFITAWNPYSQLLSKEENSRRQLSLLTDIESQGLANINGIGQHHDNGWPGEESILILGLNLDAARDLSRKYDQLAFVWHSIFRQTQLVKT